MTSAREDGMAWQTSGVRPTTTSTRRHEEEVAKQPRQQQQQRRREVARRTCSASMMTRRRKRRRHRPQYEAVWAKRATYGKTADDEGLRRLVEIGYSSSCHCVSSSPSMTAQCALRLAPSVYCCLGCSLMLVCAWVVGLAPVDGRRLLLARSFAHLLSSLAILPLLVTERRLAPALSLDPLRLLEGRSSSTTANGRVAVVPVYGWG